MSEETDKPSDLPAEGGIVNELIKKSNPCPSPICRVKLVEDWKPAITLIAAIVVAFVNVLLVSYNADLAKTTKSMLEESAKNTAIMNAMLVDARESTKYDHAMLNEVIQANISEFRPYIILSDFDKSADLLLEKDGCFQFSKLNFCQNIYGKSIFIYKLQNIGKTPAALNSIDVNLTFGEKPIPLSKQTIKLYDLSPGETLVRRLYFTDNALVRRMKEEDNWVMHISITVLYNNEYRFISKITIQKENGAYSSNIKEQSIK